jgi:hypothetical protein
VHPTRRISIATGTLFIIATVAAIAAAAIDPTQSRAPESVDPTRLALAALLYLIAAGTSVGIAISLYPVLKSSAPVLALGSVIFRSIEAVFYGVAVVSLLAILPLAHSTANGDLNRMLADSSLAMREHSTLVAVFAFSVGALMYYVAFYRSRLVARWLSGWGAIGALLMLTACLFALFSDTAVTGYTLLILPIAVQEMVLAIWLLVKGFRTEQIG